MQDTQEEKRPTVKPVIMLGSHLGDSYMIINGCEVEFSRLEINVNTGTVDIKIPLALVMVANS